MPVEVDDTTVTLTHPESAGTVLKILKFGATAISWTVAGEERLWLSEHAHLDGSKAVRGGIPLVFPRFGPPKGNHPATDKLPQHGFARNTEWEFLGQVNETTVQFGLSPEQLSDAFRAAWTYDFKLVATFKLLKAHALEITLEVTNLGQDAFDFNVLFHTYFRVPDIQYVQVTDLGNLKYEDQVSQMTETSVSGPQAVTREVDRIFERVPRRILLDYKSSPYVTIESTDTLEDAVVWNPWVEKAEALADFYPKDGYKQMVCIENGSVHKFTSLPAGKQWEGAVTYLAS